MNGRELLVNIFNGKKTERTPVTIFVTNTDIEDGPPNCVIGERTDDVIGDLIRFHEVLGIDIMLRISVDVFEPIAFDCNTESWTNIWEFSNDKKRLVHRIVTPGGELCEAFNLEGEEFHGDPTKEWMKLRNVRTEAFIKDEGDLELVKKYRPSIPDYDFSNIKKAKERLGDRGIVLPRVPSSAFNSAFGLRKLEELFMDPIIKHDLYSAIMELCTEDVIKVGTRIAQAGGDVQRVVGNVANSGMVSGDFFLEHIYPYEKRYIDALTSKESKVLFHNCGRCSGLLEVYSKMLEDQALESFSQPASGGDIENLREARQKLGDNVVMVGNFDQVHLLKDGGKQEIEKAVKKIFEQTRADDKFIFSTSDSIIPGTPKENIETMAKCALDCAD